MAVLYISELFLMQLFVKTLGSIKTIETMSTAKYVA